MSGPAAAAPRVRRLARDRDAGVPVLARVQAQPAVGDGAWTLRLEFLGAPPTGLRQADQVRIVPLGDRPMHAAALRRVPGDPAAVLVDARRDPDPRDPGTVPGSGAYLLTLERVPDLDPMGARATFSLGDEPGAAAADGAPAAAGPALPDGVRINYLAKDYDSFRTLMLDYVSAAVPGWQERSPADAGMVLVELLAYAGDALSYAQDAAATEAYLGTARLRTSLRRHARLLDYRPAQGCNAAAWVQVAVSAPGLLIPAGTPLLTRAPGAGTVLLAGSLLYERALVGARVFETLEALRPRPELNRIPLYAWGSDAYVLPAGSTQATLVDGAGPDGAGTLRLGPGDVLVLEDARPGPAGGAGDPARRHAVRLRAVTPGSDPAGADGPQPVLQVEWWGADALPFALQVSGYAGGVAFQDGAHALGNLVLADHGRTVAGTAALPPPEDDGTVRLPASAAPLTRAVPFDAEAARGLPAAAALDRPAERALPVVRVHDGRGRAWRPVYDLLGSGPFSRDVVVEVQADEQASLRFGDGRLGRRPREGVPLRAAWRLGYGPAGNVGPDALVHLVAPDAAAFPLWAARVSEVRNPVGARGGAAPEPDTRVRVAAPQAFRVQERCVTVADWVAAALDAPEVLDASAEVRWAGSWPTAFVTVQRAGGLQVDEAFAEGILAWLEPRRPVGHAVAVRGPAWVPLDVLLEVQVAPRRFQRAVEAELAAVLGDGADGTFQAGRYRFGQAVYLAPLVAAAMAVPGVVDVRPLRFRRMDAVPGSAEVTDPVAMGPREVARAATRAAGPAYGQVAFRLSGGL